MGLRDRAIIVLLYGTGIRASECAGLRECDLDLGSHTIRVAGKGGHERTVPLNEEVVRALEQYRRARGQLQQGQSIFRSRLGRGMSRNAIYERVRSNARRARLPRRVSPHRLRHSYAVRTLERWQRQGHDVERLLPLLSGYLGHVKVSYTKHYLHLTPTLRQLASERFAQLVLPRLDHGGTLGDDE